MAGGIVSRKTTKNAHAMGNCSERFRHGSVTFHVTGL
jgi:hypothetical protein